MLSFPGNIKVGEMSERFKELVLKTSDAATRRGFESHSLRQKSAVESYSGLFHRNAGDQK